MKIAFRADASTSIGSGHVMRCLRLAEALRDRGAEVRMVCRQQDGDLCRVVEQRGIALARLTQAATSAAQDAAETRAALARFAADWLVVDHYDLDLGAERALRDTAANILAIDDLTGRPHDCDVLLDQNVLPGMAPPYAGKLPEGCRLLLGPDFALLDAEYAKLRDGVAVKEGAIRRICISYGGTDPDDLTGKTLAAFLSLARKDIKADVVVGFGNLNEQAIRAQAAAQPNVRVHSRVPSLAPLLAQADIAIGAGGITSWERLCLGVPALVVTVADNQRPVAAALHERGLIRWLGHHDAVDQEQIVGALDELTQCGLEAHWSRRCRATVDGNGVVRVCAALTVGPASPLAVRRAGPPDEALLLSWANDPQVRRNSFTPQQISAGVHHDWFRKRLDNPEGCRIYVVETADHVPLGQVRLEKCNGAWELDYSLAAPFRGRGLGVALLRAALWQFHREQQAGLVIGKVKEENVASRRIFEQLGFKAAPAGADRVLVFKGAIAAQESQL